MKVAINQIRGGSGVDVWAQNLCEGLQKSGESCNLNLLPEIYQFCPNLINLYKILCNDVDVIQSNTWNGYGFKTEKSLVVTEHLVVHDQVFNPYKTLGQKLFHRQVFKFEKKSLAVADAVVCVSEDTRQKLVEVFGYTDARVIHNGIDTSIFRPRENADTMWDLLKNKTILLFAGNLSRRKGADLLPAIMNLVGDKYLLLTTSGNRDKSQNNIPHSQDLGHLNLEQLIDAYNRCDLFILPSRLEGLSLSTLEAMACAKPVIASNCSSFPELVVDGKGGFLCEKDNVKDFADRIRYLTEEPGLIKQMGEFNRERILERFTIERMVHDYIRLYDSLLE